MRIIYIYLIPAVFYYWKYDDIILYDNNNDGKNLTFRFVSPPIRNQKREINVFARRCGKAISIIILYIILQ